MTPRSAQRTVLLSLLVLVLVRTVQNARNPATPLFAPRELFGAIAIAMTLAALSEPAPTAAAGLAATAAITGTISAGPSLFRGGGAVSEVPSPQDFAPDDPRHPDNRNDDGSDQPPPFFPTPDGTPPSFPN